MKGENYYLILVHKNGTKYRVYSKPISLRMMDISTTRYESKNELVSTIINNLNLEINPKDISEVQIVMQPNLKKEEYKVEKGPLYRKDKAVLNTEAISAKFELMMLDKSFVRDFIKKYKGIKNFNGICNEIEAELKSDKYIDALSSLAEKLLSTYKGSRNIYLGMKSYESKSKKKGYSYGNVYSMTDSEKKEQILRYLQTYEPELLDIDDFTHHEDISKFDAHKVR